MVEHDRILSGYTYKGVGEGTERHREEVQRESQLVEQREGGEHFGRGHGVAKRTVVV